MVLPVSRNGSTLTLAMADPTNVFAMDDIKFMTGFNVEPVIASEASIQMSVGKYYGGSNQIDVFDAAIAIETEKAATALKNGKSGKNGQVKNGGRPASNGKTNISAEDLDVNINNFDFEVHDTEGFEVVQENEEIDLATLARASEDAPVVRLVNVLMVDASPRRVGITSSLRKRFPHPLR